MRDFANCTRVPLSKASTIDQVPFISLHLSSPHNTFALRVFIVCPNRLCKRFTHARPCKNKQDVYVHLRTTQNSRMHLPHFIVDSWRCRGRALKCARDHVVHASMSIITSAFIPSPLRDYNRCICAERKAKFVLTHVCITRAYSCTLH